MNKVWIALVLLALSSCALTSGYRNVHIHCERGEDGRWSCEVATHEDAR